MRRLVHVTALAVATALVAVGAALAGGHGDKGKFPSVIPLPTGWAPEGVAIGNGKDVYAGSLATGAVWKGDLRTGTGAVLVPPQGRPAVGLKVDKRGRIFVAGGPSGRGAVYGPDGTLIQEWTFTSGPTFVNDVVVTRDAAWFTDSFNARLYRVAIEGGGAIAATAVTVPLTGDYAQVAGFNVNGIAATSNGKWLVIVQTATGTLFRVDADSGVARRIDLGGDTVTFGDGILLEGKTLYVVRNQLNQVAVVELESDLLEGRITGVLTDPALAVPTTIARFGDALYAVNAKFGTPPAGTPYEIVRLPIDD